MTIATVFGMPVYLYGTVMAGATVLALLLAAAQAKKTGVSAEQLSWFGLLAIPFGVIFGRLGYCLGRWEWFVQQEAVTFFRLSDGGLMLYGAVVGVALAAWAAAKAAHGSLPALLDTIAAPGALMIAVMRMAEGPLGQGYGWSLMDWFDPEMGMSVVALEDYEFLQGFPFSMLDYCEDWVWAVYVMEAIFAVGILITLLRVRTTRPGWKALLFLLLYAATQALGESLRQDDLLKWGFVRMNQVLSGLVAAGVLAVCCRAAWGQATKKQMALCWIGLLASAGVVMAAEFMLEKKIVPLAFVPMDMCYVIMALACAGIVASVVPMWRTAMKTPCKAGKSV